MASISTLQTTLPIANTGDLPLRLISRGSVEIPVKNCVPIAYGNYEVNAVDHKLPLIHIADIVYNEGEFKVTKTDKVAEKASFGAYVNLTTKK